MRKRYTVFFLVLILTIVCKTGQTIAQNKENPPPLMNLPTCGHGHPEQDTLTRHYNDIPSVTPTEADFRYMKSSRYLIPSDYNFDSQTTTPTSTCINSNFSQGNFNNWSGCYGEFDPTCLVQ